MKGEYGITLSTRPLSAMKGEFDAVILAVAHSQFKDLDVRSFLSQPQKGVVYDVKGFLPREVVDGRL